MKRILKWVLLAVLLLLLLVAAGALALQRWIGSGDFKSRVEQEASTSLGVAVKLARLEVAVWPLPAVALEGLEIQTRPVLTLERLEVRPAWRPLIQGRLELATVLVRGALLPQAGVDGLVLLLQKKKLPAQTAQGPEAENSINTEYIPRHIVLDKVTWLGAKGAPITLDADAQLNPQGLPDEVSIKILKGQWQGATAELKRQGQGHDWTLALKVGGGTVQGTLQLQPAPR
ncbi:MAG: AsmA family protein, partial [Rhodoferax sp.]